MNYHDGTWDVEGEQEDAPHSPGMTTKPVGGWCGELNVHDAHGDCTGVFRAGDRHYGPGNPPPEFDPLEFPSVTMHVTCADAEEYARIYNLGFAEAVEQYTGDAGSIHSQEEFLTALDVLLDHTLHADECYIDAAQTECVCVIGKVRAVLPPCGATKWPAFAEPPRALKCVRNAHPASPDRHTFG